VDASTLAPLSRLSSLRSLRLDLCFTVSNAGGWDFLQCLQRLTSLHLEGEAAALRRGWQTAAHSPLPCAALVFDGHGAGLVVHCRASQPWRCQL
jgi:hypothetical protein